MRGVVYSGALIKPEFKGDQFLLPDESQEEYDALCKALMEVFSPETAYERLMAQNLVQIEWELKRHRRLIASHVAIESAAAVGTDKSGADRMLWKMRPEIYGEEDEGQEDGQDQKGVDPAEALMSFDPTRWMVVNTSLKREGGSLRAVVAEAYRARIADIQYHEFRIADLERRRRSLLQDYRRLQDTRPQSKLPVQDQ
jgi:hypothetical protein